MTVIANLDAVNDVANTAPPGGPAGDPVNPVNPVNPAQPVDESTKPKPQDAIIPAKVDPVVEKAEPFSFEPTGDSRLDVAIKYFGETLKFDMNSPEMQEAAKGNWEYLEAKLKGMGDKAPDAQMYLKLAQDGIAAVKQADADKGEKLVATIHEAAGSKENWEATRAYAQANLPPETIDEINAGIQQGGVVATLIVSALRAQHMESAGTVQGKSAVAGGAVVEPQVQVSYKSQAEWQVAYREFIGKHGITGAAKAPGYDALMKAFPANR